MFQHIEAKNKGLRWEIYYDEDDKEKVDTFSSEELWFPQGNDPTVEVVSSDNSKEEDSDDNDDDDVVMMMIIIVFLFYRYSTNSKGPLRRFRLRFRWWQQRGGGEEEWHEPEHSTHKTVQHKKEKHSFLLANLKDSLVLL